MSLMWEAGLANALVPGGGVGDAGGNIHLPLMCVLIVWIVGALVNAFTCVSFYCLYRLRMDIQLKFVLFYFLP